MFRFCVRDLLWLTLVVAMGLGWFVHQRQLVAQLDEANNRGSQWRMAAGALEYIVKIEGDWTVMWDFRSSRVTTTTVEPTSIPGRIERTGYATEFRGPSAPLE